MRVLIAPDKFKDSATALEVCQAIEAGIKSEIPHAECILFPLADGGDGTAAILTHHTKGKLVSIQTLDPLMRPVQASYGISFDETTAFIEMASASGLHLLKHKERNVMEATSLGTGEMILDALEKGARNIVLGVGGSATNDAATGAASVLGYEFFNSKGEVIIPVGRSLIDIKSIRSDKVNSLVKSASFTAICDVSNPLTGKDGAAYVYAPQKGASPDQVKVLDHGLRNFAVVVRNRLNISIESLAGAGAGGGFAGGAVAFFNATLQRGIDVVFAITKIETQVKDVDFIITGEGKLDKQTLHGKVVSGLAALAKKYNKKLIAVTGINELTAKEETFLGLTNVIALTDHFSEEECFNRAFDVLKDVTKNKIVPELRRKASYL